MKTDSSVSNYLDRTATSHSTVYLIFFWGIVEDIQAAGAKVSNSKNKFASVNKLISFLCIFR